MTSMNMSATLERVGLLDVTAGGDPLIETARVVDTNFILL